MGVLARFSEGSERGVSGDMVGMDGLDVHELHDDILGGLEKVSESVQ